MSKPGRPPALVADEKTLNIIEGLAKIQYTQGEAAGVLGVSRDTLHNFFSANPGARERWDNGLEGGKASIRRNQFKLCETNATMAIWLGKQYLGQRDQTAVEMSGRVEVEQVTDEQRARALALFLAKHPMLIAPKDADPGPQGATGA